MLKKKSKYQKWGAFLFFLEIENYFECSLLRASDFSIQDKVFGKTTSLLFLCHCVRVEKFIFYAFNMTQDVVFIFKAEGKILGLAPLLYWGRGLSLQMASFCFIFYCPRRAFLPLWFC